tara:strand:- start:227 stop:724 length:498 start_codon:yes stop_codon:yes gene_type:complete
MSWERKSSSVILNGYLESEISKFANLLPFDIVITDGIRSPEQQVNRMFAKLNRNPPEDLTNIYVNDEFAIEIMDAYPDYEAAKNIVLKWMSIRTPSRHLTSQAFDVRIYDKTDSQIQKMIDVAQDLNWNPFLESDHLHIGIPGQKKNYLILLLIGVGLTWIFKKS